MEKLSIKAEGETGPLTQDGRSRKGIDHEVEDREIEEQKDEIYVAIS